MPDIRTKIEMTIIVFFNMECTYKWKEPTQDIIQTHYKQQLNTEMCWYEKK